MKMSDVPFLQGEAMAESKPNPKAEEKPTATPKAEDKASATADTKPPAARTPAPKGNLLPAGSSTNPIVHGLLAELQSAQQNSNTEAERDVLDRLAELGYAAE